MTRLARTALLFAPAALVLSACATVDAGGPSEVWRFVSVPDFLNVDVGDVSGLGTHDGGPNSTSTSWEESIEWMLDRIAEERPDFVLVAGDLVMGHWERDVDERGLFGEPSDFMEEEARVHRAADLYYGVWRERFARRGLVVHAAIGDHELGDNPWPPGSLRGRLVGTYKRAFGRHLTEGRDYARPENRPWSDTVYAVQHRNVLVVSVDVFQSTPDHGIRTAVDGEQLLWLDETLTRAAQDTTIDHVVVQGHTPVLGPVRQRSSSGLMLAGGAETTFWRALEKHGVELYLAGEVHAMTAKRRGGVEQIAHGGLMGYNPTTNYMVVTVRPDRLELELREVELVNSGPKLWQTGSNRPASEVRIAPASRKRGPRTVGRLVIVERQGKSVVTERTGVFLPWVAAPPSH